MYLVHARDTLTCTRGTRQLACHTRASRARYARSSSALSVRWEGTWAGGSFHCCMLTSECRRPGSPTAVCKHPRRTAGKGKGTSGKGVGTRHDMQHKETPADSMCSADATHTGHACTCYTTMLPAPACAERQGHGSTVRARRQRARRQRAAVCGRERARKGGTRPSRPFRGTSLYTNCRTSPARSTLSAPNSSTSDASGDACGARTRGTPNRTLTMVTRWQPWHANS
jgi:hypothetical protein